MIPWSAWDDPSRSPGINHGRVIPVQHDLSFHRHRQRPRHTVHTPTECTVGRSQLLVTDGCYSLPTRHTGFRLTDSASGILTIIGLLIALPSLAFGAYRLYYKLRGDPKAPLDDEQVVLLVPVDGDGDGDGGVGSQEMRGT